MTPAEPELVGLSDLVLALRRLRADYPPLRRVEAEVVLGPNEVVTVAVTSETLSISNSQGGAVVFREDGS